MGECKFDKAWIGRCKQETVDGEEYCHVHLLDKVAKENMCAVCGKQATHDCGETFQFVCGTPLCDSRKCKVKHHPKNFVFTPLEWTKTYDIDIYEEMFGELWETEISHETFLQKATKPIVATLSEHLTKSLGNFIDGYEIKTVRNFHDVILIELTNGLTMRYELKVW